MKTKQTTNTKAQKVTKSAAKQGKRTAEQVKADAGAMRLVGELDEFRRALAGRTRTMGTRKTMTTYARALRLLQREIIKLSLGLDAELLRRQQQGDVR
jgi:hypothetical protein